MNELIQELLDHDNVVEVSIIKNWYDGGFERCIKIKLKDFNCLKMHEVIHIYSDHIRKNYELVKNYDCRVESEVSGWIKNYKK